MTQLKNALNSVKKFKKKPVLVEALQYTGENGKDCRVFLNGNFDNTLSYPNVSTLHGTVRVDVRDWIIKGPAGDFWPCKPDIFEEFYEPESTSSCFYLGGCV